ncbi:MAG: hypothetical protein JKY50_00855 [Oleispira sp.]|nr:hypothetical protein [Oleispira sp.]
MATREDILDELNRRRIQEELATRGAQAPDQNFPGASVMEPAATVAAGFAADVVGGVAGGVQALFGDPAGGAETLENVKASAFQPKTPAGKAGLQTLGDLAKQGLDLVNFPISGLAGLAKLATGGTLEEAAGTVAEVQEVGPGKALGGAVLEATDSPVLATLAETALSGAGDIAGLKGLGKGLGATGRAAGAGLEITGLDKIAIPQSATKQKIAKMIQQGSTDIETAEFKLKPGTDAPKTRIEKFLKIGGPKIQKDPVAIESLTQGFDPGVVAMIKGADPADRAKFLQMTNLMEKGKRNALFAVKNRPGRVAGNSLLDRFKTVVAANKQAGKDLGNIIDKIKADGNPVTINVKEAGASFQKNLDDLGITMNDDKTPNFSDSDIEDLAGPTQAIERIIKRMVRIKNPTAANLHRFKKQIDEVVTFGKSGEGLSGRVESTLKTLRHDINVAIGEKIPAYAQANKAFSETITAIDDLQAVAGKKMNLDGSNAQEATGVLLRGLMSNNKSRTNLIDSIKLMEDTANKYGRLKTNARGELLLEPVGGPNPLFPDDIMAQALFADELDSVFGPAARTSFQGQIGQAVDRTARAAQALKEGGVVSAGIAGAGAIADKLKGVNQENAFKSMRQLLKNN